TDEIRSIPYFSGQYNDPGQYPKQPRRRRGPLSLILNGIGILAFGFLLIGFLALVFDWDSSDIAVDDFYLEEFFVPDDASEQADPLVPLPCAVDGSLVAQVDHVHQGITIGCENGGQHPGPGL